MISYGALSSRRPYYLNREMTGGVNTIQKHEMVGEIDVDQEIALSRAILSAVEAPDRWSVVCRILGAGFFESEVVMFPVEWAVGSIHSSSPKQTKPRPLSKETLAELYKQKSVAFRHEPFSTEDGKRSPDGRVHAYVTLLNFGIGGCWVMRITIPDGTQCFVGEQLETLNRHAALLGLAATASAQVMSLSIESYTTAFQHAGRAFAVLDDALQVIAKNKHFQTVFAQYFQDAAGFLAQTGSPECRAFRNAISAFCNGRPHVELILLNEHHPCLVVLHDVPANRHLVSGKKLIGLELRGALHSPVANGKVLAALFGLTQREGDVVALLSSGKGVGAIAKDHAVSIGTVRVQLKAVFRKMGVAGQVELVSKVLGFRF